MKHDIVSKSEEHLVEHVHSGKGHIFKVTSSSGETYNVVVSVGCDCRFMGVKGIANNRVCSHVLAVLKSIREGVLYDCWRNVWGTRDL